MGQVLGRPGPRAGGRKNEDDSSEKDLKQCLPLHQPKPVQTLIKRVPTLKQLEKNCNIQPHTDEGGDAYYIGDFGEPAKCAIDWKINDTHRPYLRFIKHIAKSRPHLEYLAHWMEVTCAPPKWKFIKEHPANRESRAQRCNITVLDFAGDDDAAKRADFNDTEKLQSLLEKDLPAAEKPPIRLIIAEDLSRDVVEVLGSTYDIDPLFFLSHIGDYLFHNTRDRWVELPDLDADARRRDHFNVQYLRARYFKTAEAFEEAENESGSFNVLRRLDSDRSRKRLQDSLLDVRGASVTLTRSKSSVWIKPRKFDSNEPIIAILLVDPTVAAGTPLWGGYRPFENTPSMYDESPPAAPATPASLFNDVVHWSSKLSADEIRADPKCLALPIYRLVLANWRTVLKYMATMLGKIEWEFENPHWGEAPADVDNSLRKLSPWRRNVPYYQGMIAESIDRIFNVSPANHKENLEWKFQPRPDDGVFSLLHDFRLVQQSMDASQRRIGTIQATASNRINIEESRRAVQQNMSLARLTFLATIFIPLNFTSSFLSMSPDFAGAVQTVWMFFAIGIPLTISALVTVDLSNPQEGYIRKKWRTWQGKDPSAPSTKKAQAAQQVQIGRTMPWLTERGDSRTRVRS